MPVIQEVVHKRGLDFENQRKVVMLRDTKQLGFSRIAERVVNLEGEQPSEDVVRRAYARFSRTKGRVQYKYHKCGRQPWKITKEVGTFLVKQLLKKRKTDVCTSTTLQADLYKEKKMKVSLTAIRKHLISKGYSWMPRSQKRKYSKEMMQERMAFANRCRSKSLAAIQRHITFAMDGVVLTVPPPGEL